MRDDFDVVLYIVEHIARSVASTVKQAREQRKALHSTEADTTSNQQKAA